VRIARFSVSGPPDSSGAPGESQVAFGVVDGEGPEATVTAINGHPFGAFEVSTARFPLSAVRLLSPVLPSKVVAIGRNYAEHAAEMGNEVPDVPMLFFKPSTSVIGPGDAIRYPRLSTEVHHEAELAVVIGRLCREVPVERAHEVILGYTCGNDVSARDFQRTDGQWARAKGSDTFCPLGPWVTTDIDASDLEITCTVDGVLRQQGRTSQMLRGIPELIATITESMTLLPGDVILTGTPAGVGPLMPGESVSVTIENIGTLTNRVVAQ
jgi:2-keto-4-pentenoate hydratase/2-oxohepta-3-ene-1,7-dioic acid hydratase in catechol pathway